MQSMLEPPASRASVIPAAAEPLPPEVEVSTPGAVLVVDEGGRLRDRSPRAALDPELGALVSGTVMPEALFVGATRRLVHDGSALDAIWLPRGETALVGGLDERDFGAMLHRLRNVVGIVVASVEAEELIAGNEGGASAVSSQLGSTRRRETDRLVDALGSLGHAFAGTGARTYVDLELVLRRAIDALRGTAKRKGVALRLEGARDARRPRTGDEGLLEAGLAALLSNAIFASASGGEVRVAAEASMAAVTLTIEDDGPGLIAPSRGDVGTAFSSSKRGGLGLGLVVARRAAFVHGGELRVATRERGHGVSASMWIPTAMS